MPVQENITTTLSTITSKSQAFLQKPSAFDLLFLLLCTSPPQLQTEVFGSLPCPFIALLCFTANPYGNRTCKVMDSYKNLIILKPCTERFLLLLDTVEFPALDTSQELTCSEAQELLPVRCLQWIAECNVMGGIIITVQQIRSTFRPAFSSPESCSSSSPEGSEEESKVVLDKPTSCTHAQMQQLKNRELKSKEIFLRSFHYGQKKKYSEMNPGVRKTLPFLSLHGMCCFKRCSDRSSSPTLILISLKTQQKDFGNRINASAEFTN
ncbi:hypothetical protein EK904_010743 [Melospiza melodia maxima]|nr:hypothetical protein EK904_010743 [Melospiza melodia maxima]